MTTQYIIDFLREHKPILTEMGVQRIGLFGSFATGTQRPDSDIDVLVDMEPSFINMANVAIFLEEHFQRKVDLLRRGPHLRDKFL